MNLKQNLCDLALAMVVSTYRFGFGGGGDDPRDGVSFLIASILFGRGRGVCLFLNGKICFWIE